MYETNVATLPDDAIKPRIEYITHLIQSGEADKCSFQAGNGDQTTNSIHQFLFWLQQRAQEMESDGTYSPGMVGQTGTEQLIEFPCLEARVVAVELLDSGGDGCCWVRHPYTSSFL